MQSAMQHVRPGRKVPFIAALAVTIFVIGVIAAFAAGIGRLGPAGGTVAADKEWVELKDWGAGNCDAGANVAKDRDVIIDIIDRTNCP